MDPLRGLSGSGAAGGTPRMYGKVAGGRPDRSPRTTKAQQMLRRKTTASRGIRAISSIDTKRTRLVL